MPSSVISRLLFALGGLLLLLILFVGVKNILTSDSGNGAALAKVVSQQQELITITAAATAGSQPLSSSSLAIANTTQISISSAQSQLQKYLKTAGHKITKEQLIYPGSKAVTDQLSASVAAGTYDATLQQVLKNQLLDYQTSLKIAYAKTPGNKGRVLLQSQYDGATLLLRQFGPTQ